MSFASEPGFTEGQNYDRLVTKLLMSFSGYCNDVYDMETVGKNSYFGAASRIQTCYRPGVRDAGLIYQVYIALDKTINWQNPVELGDMETLESRWRSN